MVSVLGDGKVIGRSTVRKGNHSYWPCVCDCGTKKMVDGVSLRNGKSKSCGCLRREAFINQNMRYSAKNEHSK